MERWLGLAETALRAVQPGLPEWDPARCLPARHAGSGCVACRAACPRTALGDGPVPRPDAYACDGCGACVAVCPTGALRSASLTAALNRWLSSIGSPRAVVATVACERSRAAAPPSEARPVAARLTVPCLGALRPADIVAARARGATELTLLSVDCASCDRASAGAACARSIAVAGTALSALGAPMVIRHVVGPDGQTGGGEVDASLLEGEALSRRDLFGLWRETARRAAAEVIHETEPAASYVGRGRSVPGWRGRLERDVSALAGGEGGDAALPVELGMGIPTVRGECDGCGLCALVCPLGALSVAGARVSCLPAACTACGLCAAVCPTGALVIGSARPRRGPADGLPSSASGTHATLTSEAGLMARAASVDTRIRAAARRPVPRLRAPLE